MADFWTPGPMLVAGPCALQNHELNVEIAGAVHAVATKHRVRGVFKASFDKANRSNADAPRGPGLESGLQLLSGVKSEIPLPVLTDVHEVWQVERAAEVVDALQVPALLCRQTDLLEAVGASGLPVNIKKGQWMSAEAMRGAVDKVRKAGCHDLAVTERGSFFGYGDLVVDMRNFRRIREATGATVIFDATHSLQRPGMGPRGSSGGNRDHVSDLLRAAAAVGADGFFLETHPTPNDAPSDAATMLPLNELDGVIERTMAVWHSAKER